MVFLGKRTLQPPFQTRLVDQNGYVESAWHEWFISVGLAAEKLREGAQAMEDISFGTDGFATATDIATAWESLRDIWQEIP